MILNEIEETEKSYLYRDIGDAWEAFSKDIRGGVGGNCRKGPIERCLVCALMSDKVDLDKGPSGNGVSQKQLIGECVGD